LSSMCTGVHYWSSPMKAPKDNMMSCLRLAAGECTRALWWGIKASVQRVLHSRSGEDKYH
jgi:hypothetical protein